MNAQLVIHLMNHYSTRFYHGHQLSFSSQIQQLTPHCLSLSLRYRVTFNMVAESQDRKNTEVLKKIEEYESYMLRRQAEPRGSAIAAHNLPPR